MRIISWIRNILCVISIVILIAAAACFIFRIRPATVMSGSMEPAFHVGSVVFVAKGREAGIGDAIAFNVGGNYVTHRITGEDDKGWITKGDNNKTEDPWRVAKDGIEGKVLEIGGIGCIPLLGCAFHFFSSKRGIIIAAAVMLCLILSLAMTGTDDSYTGEDP